jgi:hypothetical protein
MKYELLTISENCPTGEASNNLDWLCGEAKSPTVLRWTAKAKRTLDPVILHAHKRTQSMRCLTRSRSGRRAVDVA